MVSPVVINFLYLRGMIRGGSKLPKISNTTYSFYVAIYEFI